VLTDFLASGPPPVFVGFGSTVKSEEQAECLSGVVRDSVRRAGVRGIVQSGWAGLEVVGDDVLTVGDVPHHWLFPRTAAVAHHCGAGTAAAGLRAGVPTIAIPGLGDQPFWARRLLALGVSAATIPQRKLTSERLADAVRIAVCDRRLRDASRSIAAIVNAEDGEGRAVEAVQKVLAVSS
jgi:UDP:flavonoid glycosyltransferase YjiC (YdhE family)